MQFLVLSPLFPPIFSLSHFIAPCDEEGFGRQSLLLGRPSLLHSLQYFVMFPPLVWEKDRLLCKHYKVRNHFVLVGTYVYIYSGKFLSWLQGRMLAMYKLVTENFKRKFIDNAMLGIPDSYEMCVLCLYVCVCVCHVYVFERVRMLCICVFVYVVCLHVYCVCVCLCMCPCMCAYMCCLICGKDGAKHWPPHHGGRSEGWDFLSLPPVSVLWGDENSEWDILRWNSFVDHFPLWDAMGHSCWPVPHTCSETRMGLFSSPKWADSEPVQSNRLCPFSNTHTFL